MNVIVADVMNATGGTRVDVAKKAMRRSARKGLNTKNSETHISPISVSLYDVSPVVPSDNRIQLMSSDGPVVCGASIGVFGLNGLREVML